MGAELDYEVFKRDQEKYLEQLGKRKVIIAFSGGKDSTVILHFMNQIVKDYDFEIEAQGVINPVHVYAGEEKTIISEYWQKRGIDIVWHTTGKDNDDDLESFVKKGESPCIQCSDSRKIKLLEYLMVNEKDLGNLAIVMGYSLWDLSSAMIEHILRENFGGGEGGSFQGQNIKERFLVVSQRFYPLIRMDKGLIFYKPLVFYNDKAIEDVIKREKLPVLTTECRYKNYRPKRLLSEYYKQYQLNFSFDQLLEFAVNKLELPGLDLYEKSHVKDFVKNYI